MRTADRGFWVVQVSEAVEAEEHRSVVWNDVFNQCRWRNIISRGPEPGSIVSREDVLNHQVAPLSVSLVVVTPKMARVPFNWPILKMYVIV